MFKMKVFRKKDPPDQAGFSGTRSKGAFMISRKNLQVVAAVGLSVGTIPGAVWMRRLRLRRRDEQNRIELLEHLLSEFLVTLKYHMGEYDDNPAHLTPEEDMRFYWIRMKYPEY